MKLAAVMGSLLALAVGPVCAQTASDFTKFSGGWLQMVIKDPITDVRRYSLGEVVPGGVLQMNCAEGKPVGLSTAITGIRKSAEGRIKVVYRLGTAAPIETSWESENGLAMENGDAAQAVIQSMKGQKKIAIRVGEVYDLVVDLTGFDAAYEKFRQHCAK